MHSSDVVMNSDRLAARQVTRVTSTHSASSSYHSMSSQIRTLRQDIASGRVSASEARSKFQSFASKASSTFSAINGCSVCYGGHSAVSIPSTHTSRPSNRSLKPHFLSIQTSMTQSAQQTYSEFNSLIQTSNRVFGSQAPTVLSCKSDLLFIPECAQDTDLHFLSQRLQLSPGWTRNSNRT